VFCFTFRRNPWALIERKISRAISRKIRGSRNSPEHQRKQSREKQQTTQPCNRVAQPCTRDRSHARAASRRSTVVLWSCLDARPPVRLAHGRECGARATVRLCTAVPARTSTLRVRFSVFLNAVLFFFEGEAFFCSVLGREWGFSIASINSFSGRLD